MSQLPIDAHLAQILSSLEAHPNLVLVAAPGAGKTTRLPPALLTASWRRDRDIVVLEPRRLAAVSASYRVAEELGSECGALVGYQVRFDNRTSQSTRLRFMTEAILARQMSANKELA